MADKQKKEPRKKIDINTTNKDAQLELVKKAIVKKYGNVMSKLSDYDDTLIQTISSGCIGLDLAMGRGGFARGRIYEVYGPQSSGKTTLALNAVIQAQKRALKGCFIDAEHSADRELFRNYGVDIEALDMIQGYDGEANLDILEKLVRTGAYDIAVVDSVSALVPRVEAEADIDKEFMGLHARLMSKALRRLAPLADEVNCLIIFINQLRMKIGSYGDPTTTTGGEALGFYASGRIFVRGPEAKSRRIVDPATGDVIGHTTEFEMVKNKLAPPFKKATVNLMYGKGYDLATELVDLAVSIGVIDKAGSWYKYNSESIGQGSNGVVAYLKEHEDTHTEIRTKVLDILGIEEIYKAQINNVDEG